MDFVDSNATNPAGQFYRVWHVPPTPPSFTVLNVATNTTLIRVDSASRPYMVGVSTNRNQLTVLRTNFSLGLIQTAAASKIGNADMLTTFLTASQPILLASGAFGMQRLFRIEQFGSRQFLDKFYLYQDQRPGCGRGGYQSVCQQFRSARQSVVRLNKHEFRLAGQ